MRDKVDPYLRPLYDALYDVLPPKRSRRISRPAYRSRAARLHARAHLDECVRILDEAQNTTSMQMKMFLTRLGENAKMVVTGDPSQVDLPPGSAPAWMRRSACLMVSKASRRSAFWPATSFGVISWPASSPPMRRQRLRGQGAEHAVSRSIEPPLQRQIGRHPVWFWKSSSRTRWPAIVDQTSCDEIAAAIGQFVEFDGGERAVVAFSRRCRCQSLNRQYRSKDKPTNVLSFPRPDPVARWPRCDLEAPFSAISSWRAKRSSGRL